MTGERELDKLGCVMCGSGSKQYRRFSRPANVPSGQWHVRCIDCGHKWIEIRPPDTDIDAKIDNWINEAFES